MRLDNQISTVSHGSRGEIRPCQDIALANSTSLLPPRICPSVRLSVCQRVQEIQSYENMQSLCRTARGQPTQQTASFSLRLPSVSLSLFSSSHSLSTFSYSVTLSPFLNLSNTTSAYQSMTDMVMGNSTNPVPCSGSLFNRVNDMGAGEWLGEGKRVGVCVSHYRTCNLTSLLTVICVCGVFDS